MKTAVLPHWSEEDRLKALASYDIFDTPQEKDFDDIAQLAAEICGTPISMVNFIGRDRQFYKAKVGVQATGTPRDVSFCDHTIRQRDVLVVPDTMLDPRFKANPFVAGKPNLRFYAGALLQTPEGLPIGTMCVVDLKPREFTEREIFALKTLARQVMLQLELRRSRQELLQQNEKLESSVKERTAKLQETVDELAAFSYSISHDLRAPLRAMQSFAECLTEECGHLVTEDGRDYLRRIISASGRMDRLIQDILIYSRLGRAETKLERVDLNELLRDLIESDFHEQTVDASFEVESDLPAVNANESLLVQCFSNLIGNAIKFVAPGVMPVIRISAERAGDRVHVFIHDNGIGIDKHHQERVFGLFQQVQPLAGSTGIGLAVARKAAQRVAGTLEVKSAPGEGSTFVVNLKAAE